MSSGFELSNKQGALCCICFEWTLMEDLALLPNGIERWNVCQTCADLEVIGAVFIWMAEGRR